MTSPLRIDDPALAERFADYAVSRLDGVDRAETTGFQRIHGGASRQTYCVDLDCFSNGSTDPERRQLILRRDPAASLINTERTIEFAAYRSVAGADLPVPEALFLEADPAPLGTPFFVMERIATGTATNPFEADPYGDHRTAIGAAFFQHLGTIASIYTAGTPLALASPPVTEATAWDEALSHWEYEIDLHESGPLPVVRAAIRHLRRHPPPPAQKLSIVHGDYRTGNFLHDGRGLITGILDWEMAHIGDPFEDLAWATDPLWSQGQAERAAALLPWPEAIAIWENASGCRFDKDAFEWWSMFASVKGMGIWVSSADTFLSGANRDPILGWSGWYTHAAHTLVLSMRLKALLEARA